MAATPSIPPGCGAPPERFTRSRLHPILNRNMPHEGSTSRLPRHPHLGGGQGPVVHAGWRFPGYGLTVGDRNPRVRLQEPSTGHARSVPVSRAGADGGPARCHRPGGSTGLSTSTTSSTTRSFRPGPAGEPDGTSFHAGMVPLASSLASPRGGEPAHPHGPTQSNGSSCPRSTRRFHPFTRWPSPWGSAFVPILSGSSLPGPGGGTPARAIPPPRPGAGCRAGHPRGPGSSTSRPPARPLASLVSPSPSPNHRGGRGGRVPGHFGAGPGATPGLRVGPASRGPGLSMGSPTRHRSPAASITWPGWCGSWCGSRTRGESTLPSPVSGWNWSRGASTPSGVLDTRLRRGWLLSSLPSPAPPPPWPPCDWPRAREPLAAGPTSGTDDRGGRRPGARWRSSWQGSWTPGPPSEGRGCGHLPPAPARTPGPEPVLRSWYGEAYAIDTARRPPECRDGPR